MITINYNGKTYRSKGQFYHIESIIDWIACGDLEEVKENKELPEYNTFTLENITLPKGTTFEIKDGIKTIKLPDTSILEKLREELDRLVELFVLPQSSRAAILDFLTSLETPPEEFDTKQERISYRDLCSNTETKEEPTHKGEHQNDVCSKVTPQFTPGQEIEVSDDGDKWYTSVFEKKEFDGFRCKHDGLWLFARPIEDKIELLPAYEPSEPDWRDTQISLLTRTVNQLISK